MTPRPPFKTLALAGLVALSTLLGCLTDEANPDSEASDDSVWMVIRDVYSWDDGFSSGGDTTVYDTSNVLFREFLWIHDDTLEAIWNGGSVLLSTTRLRAEQWKSMDNDTIRAAFQSSDRLTMTVSGYDAEYQEEFVSVIMFVRYTRPFPPPEWTDVSGDGEPNETAAQAIAIQVNAAPRAGSLTVGDADWFSFVAQTGQTYRITTYGNTDTHLRLYGIDGTTLLDENDDISEDVYTSRITWQGTSSGTFYFSVRGYEDFETGAYTVGVATGSAAKPAASSTVSHRKGRGSWL